MTRITTYFLFLLSTIVLLSCKTESKESNTYFGGKIINPKTKNVILYYQEKAIDTLILDNNHKFLGKYNFLKEGLYHFKHGNEYQYIYLEPKDSLMLRLNAWDFDESLVYAGIGAERNNILIDCFLEDEKEKKLFYQFNRLNSKDFKIKVDSLLNLKLETYNKYFDNYPKETEGFKEVLKVALTYPIYSKIERYPIKHTYYSKSNSYPEVDANFYDFRKNTTTNSNALMYYSPYSRYIINYLYNKTYAIGYSPFISEYSEEFTIDLLNTIDSEIKSESIKNPLLKQTIIGHFYRRSGYDVNKKAFDKFFNLSTDKNHVDQMQKFLSDIKILPKNEQIPNFSVTNYNNADQKIKDITKGKNTLLIFWSPEFYDKSYFASRIKYLSRKFSNIEFILFKTDGNTSSRIKKLDIKKQFYIKTNSEAHKFLTSKMPRSILIDKKGKIVNGYASISSGNLNSYLKELNKK